MKKKLMAMLLSMTLLGALGGCGVTTAPNTDSNSGTASSSSGGVADGKTKGKEYLKDGLMMVMIW